MLSKKFKKDAINRLNNMKTENIIVILEKIGSRENIEGSPSDDF